MKNNAIIRELKRIDKNTFRMLNGNFRYDFEKRFALVKVSAPFTVAKCWKALAEKGYTSKDSRAVVLMDASGACASWRKYTVTELDTDTNFSVDLKLYRGCDGFHTAWDSFYAKYDFNDYRKMGGVVAYVLAQKFDDLSPFRLETEKPDLTERFKLLDVRKCCVYDRSKSYIGGLFLSLAGSKFTNYEYRPAYTRGNEYEDAGEIIDKSGYILTEKRNELKRKANETRKERAAADFKATNNTAIIKAVNDRIKALQANIASAFSSATTSIQVSMICEVLNGWRGFGRVVDLYERLVNGEKEKTFASVAAFNDALHEVNTQIDKTTELLQAAVVDINNKKGVLL